MASTTTDKIWTTLLTNRGYLAGLLVLDQSIKKHGSAYPLVVMISGPVTADQPFLDTLEAAGIPVKVVDKITPKPRPGVEVPKGTWEKLAPWSFTEYERVVLLDSDQIAMHNFDELMTVDLGGRDNIASTHACTCNPRKLAHYPKDWIPENCGFTAADPATGEPAPITSSSPKNHHLLNSGTVVLQPSKEQYDRLIHTMDTHPDVPKMIFFDQDLLPIVYPNWKPLPYIYNGLKTLRGCHSSLWRDDKVKIIHYILQKPWKSRVVEQDVIGSTHKYWWDEYERIERMWLKSGNSTKIALWKEVVQPQVASNEVNVETLSQAFPQRVSQIAASAWTGATQNRLPASYQIPEVYRSTESVLLAALIVALVSFVFGRASAPKRSPQVVRLNGKSKMR